MDGKVLLAESYIPLLQGLRSDEPRVQAALERLRGWDMQADPQSVPAALFEIFYMQLAEVVMADEVGEARDVYLGNGDAQRIFFHTIAGQPDAAWWDNVTTDAVETREQAIMQALENTVAWFEENVGDDAEAWTWGELHTATFVSQPLGLSGIGVIERLVNRGPYPVGGSKSAVNATSWSWEEPAAVRGLPSLRMVLTSPTLTTTGHPHDRPERAPTIPTTDLSRCGRPASTTLCGSRQGPYRGHCGSPEAAARQPATDRTQEMGMMLKTTTTPGQWRGCQEEEARCALRGRKLPKKLRSSTTSSSDLQTPCRHKRRWCVPSLREGGQTRLQSLWLLLVLRRSRTFGHPPFSC